MVHGPVVGEVGGVRVDRRGKLELLQRPPVVAQHRVGHRQPQRDGQVAGVALEHPRQQRDRLLVALGDKERRAGVHVVEQVGHRRRAGSVRPRRRTGAGVDVAQAGQLAAHLVRQLRRGLGRIGERQRVAA